MASDSPASAVNSAKVSALLNGRYHADREAWFDLLHRLMLLAVIVGGTSAVADLLNPRAKAIVTLVVVICGAVDLVFALTERARAHSFLRKQYFAVAAALELPTADAAEAQSEMMLLAAEEEPPYCAAHALAENWAISAVFGSEASPPCNVGFIQRCFRHFVRFDSTNFGCKQ